MCICILELIEELTQLKTNPRRKQIVFFQPHQLSDFGSHTAWQDRTEQQRQREYKAMFLDGTA